MSDRSVTFAIPGTSAADPSVIVTATEQADGSLLFELTVAGGVADIRGLFFDVNDAGPFGNLQAVGADVRDRPSEDGAFEGDDDGPHVGFDIGSGQLTPTDDDDDSYVEITVMNDIDDPPVADAGADETINESDPDGTVTLNAIGSSDPNPGDTIDGWLWSYESNDTGAPAPTIVSPMTASAPETRPPRARPKHERPFPPPSRSAVIRGTE